MQSEGGLRIVQLTAENVKRLVAVDITPVGNVIEIRGRNGAGKSSVLDSIAYALGGASLCPSQPIRRGEDRAEVVVNLGSLIVKRTWTLRGSYVSVTTPDGAPCKGPQAVLDELVGTLAFDPLEFTRQTATQQRETLLDLVGVRAALAEMDGREKAAVEARRDIGRDHGRQEAVVRAMPAATPGTTKTPVDTRALLAELDAARKRMAEIAAVGQAVIDAERDGKEAAHKAQFCAATLASIQQNLDAATKAKREADQAVAAARSLWNERKLAHTEAMKTAPDDQAIVARLAGAEGINKRVQAAMTRKSAEATLKELAKKLHQSEADVEAVRKQRRDVLKAAKFPVDGLGFGEAGVTFGGVPLDQASSAEQLRVSLAIAMAFNPKLRVLLIRDGSLLDDDSMAAVCEEIADKGYQLWIERVGGDAPGAIVIEEGEVQDAATA
jgi:hypothetical protein